MEKECSCLKDVREKVIAKVLENKDNPNGFKILESDWEHKSWFPKVRLYANYTFKTSFTKKDGNTSQPKNGYVSIFFTYCPFCGKKYEE